MKDNNFVISADMVYTILINYGVNNNENIRPLFNIWVDRFNKRPGINVIYLKNSYFCYFASGIFNPMNSIKFIILLTFSLFVLITKSSFLISIEIFEI